MTKHISTLLLLIAMMLPCSVKAELSIGQWRFYPAFQGGGTRSLVALGDKIYARSGINLFSIDTKEGDVYTFSRDNVLHDIKVDSIVAVPKGNQLLVIYEGGNIDFVQPDGTAAFQGAIANTAIEGSREVRDVAVDDNRIYVGTDFGLVVIDPVSHNVIESTQYHGTSSSGNKVPHGGPNAMALSGNTLLMLFGEDLYTVDVTDPKASLRDPSVLNYVGKLPGVTNLVGEDGKRAFAWGKGSQQLQQINLPATTTAGNVNVTNLFKSYAPPVKLAQGIHASRTDNKLVELGADGFRLTAMWPQELQNRYIISSGAPADAVWVATPDGICRYDLTQTPAIMTAGPIAPDINSVFNVSNLRLSQDNKRIFVSTRSSTFDRISASGTLAEPLRREYRDVEHYGALTPAFIDVIEDGEVRPIHYTNKMFNGDNGKGIWITKYVINRYGDVITAPNAIAENPNDPGQIWVASAIEGLYRIQDGEVNGLFGGQMAKGAVSNFKYRNMPVSGTQSQLIHDVIFDRDGNLWVLASNQDYGQTKEESEAAQLMMLPKSKVNAEHSSITIDDWVCETSMSKPLIPKSYEMKFEGRLINLESIDMFVLPPYVYDAQTILYHHKGTMADTTDDVAVSVREFIDQDGNRISATELHCAAVDASGHLLLPYLGGFIMIENPRTFDPARDRVKRLKVSRNDGTGNADYLLNGVRVSGITFDAAGRMWVSTEGSGISVISPDYSRVLAQYTTDNSPLPTNYVSAIIADPNSNKIYFGTRYGLGEYASDQSPVAEDYSDVRVYPNPVRPEYDGHVTIDRLMDNSLVKIVDAMGHMVWSDKSLGGMARWNQRDINGNRVASGVYYVVTSQVEDGGDKGRVAAKILIMR